MDKNFRIKIYAIILVLVLLAYSNSFGNQFVWDDEFLVVNNPLIRSFSLVPKVLSTELRFTNPVAISNYYRPLQTLSYCLDYFFYKLNPAGFHLTNTILHILNAILVLELIFLITKDSIVSSIAAVLFSLHPAHVQAVTYISGRADLILGVFFVLALILYIKHLDYPGLRGNQLYLVSILLFVLALLSKELALVFPLILVVYDLFNRKVKFSRYIPFLVIEGIYLALRFTIINFTGNALFTIRDALIFDPVKLFKVIITYAKITILPINLHTGRLLPQYFSLSDALLLIPFLLLFVVSFRVYKQKKRIIYFSCLWFWVILVSQSNIFLRTINVQSAEHFLYLPLIGFFLILGLLIKRLIRRNKFIGRFFLVSLIGFYCLICLGQNLIWRDSVRLYRWSLKYSPHNFTIHNNLGLEYEKRGLFKQAIEEFETALKYKPNYIDSLVNLGNVYHRLGRDRQAKEIYIRALEFYPDHKILRQNYRIIFEQSSNGESK